MIELQNLHKSFGAKVVLKGLSLTIRDGDPADPAARDKEAVLVAANVDPTEADLYPIDPKEIVAAASGGAGDTAALRIDDDAADRAGRDGLGSDKLRRPKRHEKKAKGRPGNRHHGLEAPGTECSKVVAHGTRERPMPCAGRDTGRLGRAFPSRAS